MRYLILTLEIALTLNITACGKAPDATLSPEQVCESTWANEIGSYHVVVVGNNNGSFVPAGCTVSDGQAKTCNSKKGQVTSLLNGTIECGKIGSIQVTNAMPTWIDPTN